MTPGEKKLGLSCCWHRSCIQATLDLCRCRQANCCPLSTFLLLKRTSFHCTAELMCKWRTAELVQPVPMEMHPGGWAAWRLSSLAEATLLNANVWGPARPLQLYLGLQTTFPSILAGDVVGIHLCFLGYRDSVGCPSKGLIGKRLVSEGEGTVSSCWLCDVGISVVIILTLQGYWVLNKILWIPCA